MKNKKSILIGTLIILILLSPVFAGDGMSSLRQIKDDVPFWTQFLQSIGPMALIPYEGINWGCDSGPSEDPTKRAELGQVCHYNTRTNPVRMQVYDISSGSWMYISGSDRDVIPNTEGCVDGLTTGVTYGILVYYCDSQDSVTCQDSDGGVDVFIKGYVDSIIGRIYDTCEGENSVKEYSCLAGIRKETIIDCRTYGYGVCQDAVCVGCQSGWTGSTFCEADKVYQNYQNSDCTTTKKLREDCTALGKICSQGVCKEECTDTSWSPATSTICSGQTFTQTSNCGTTRTTTGTKTCVGETCSDGIQNQGETGIDCGGPCTPCGAPPPSVEPWEIFDITTIKTLPPSYNYKLKFSVANPNNYEISKDTELRYIRADSDEAKRLLAGYPEFLFAVVPRLGQKEIPSCLGDKTQAFEITLGPNDEKTFEADPETPTVEGDYILFVGAYEECGTPEGYFAASMVRNIRITKEAEPTTEVCDDDLDNDFDGNIDLDDTECQGLKPSLKWDELAKLTEPMVEQSSCKLSSECLENNCLDLEYIDSKVPGTASKVRDFLKFEFLGTEVIGLCMEEEEKFDFIQWVKDNPYLAGGAAILLIIVLAVAAAPSKKGGRRY